MGSRRVRGGAGSAAGRARTLASLALFAVALSLAAPACTTADDPALVPGTFRFTSVDHAGLGYAWTIVIEPDGAVTISSTPGTYALPGCHGALTASELSELGSALGAAHFLERDGESLRSFASSDPPSLDLTLEIVSGPEAGRRSHVYYEPWGADAQLDRVTALPNAVYQRLYDEGACVDCPPASTCYQAHDGDSSLCAGRERITCDGASAATVVDCTWPTPRALECEPALGWVPALRWTLVSATLMRRATTSDWPNLYFELELDVDNRGLQVELPLPWAFMELRDGAGAVVPFGTTPMSGGFAEVVLAPAHSRTTLQSRFSMGVPPTAPPLAATSLQLALRERPFAGAPFGTPVPLPITDSP